jgi:aminoglycoside 3-N-acetyltransferase
LRPSPSMVTREDMVHNLRALGVTVGQILLVSASLRSIGWVEGGAEAVVDALCDVLKPGGTLVVLTETADNSDSSRQHLAKIKGMTEQEVQRFRADMPPFDRDATPSTCMGRIAEAVRTHPDAIRSDHPQSSFAAIGPMAAELMADHELACHLGYDSPLGKMCRRGGSALLLGVGFQACTAFHLAEYLYVKDPPKRKYRCVIKSGSDRRWEEYEDVVLDDSDFEAIGEELDQKGIPDYGQVGGAACRLMPLATAVKFAASWMREHRRP